MHKSSNNNPNDNINQTQNGECYDYRYGFCIAGPNCQYRHVKRMPEDLDNIRLPNWYFVKIKRLFAQDHVTNYQQIHEFLSLLNQ